MTQTFGPFTPIDKWAFAAAPGYRVEVDQVAHGEYRVVVVQDDRVGFAGAALVPAARLAVKAGKGVVKIVQRVKDADLNVLNNARAKVDNVRARFAQRGKGEGRTIKIRAPLSVAGVAGCKCDGGE